MKFKVLIRVLARSNLIAVGEEVVTGSKVPSDPPQLEIRALVQLVLCMFILLQLLRKIVDRGDVNRITMIRVLYTYTSD